MKTTVKCFVCALLLVALGSAASASVVGYVYPPPFEPQRTMFWTFDSEAWQNPITAVGPTWDTGDWTCDDVTFSDNLHWYDTNSNFPGHQGMIGLDNTLGQTGQDIWFKFHINNYSNENPVKKLWIELVGFDSQGDAGELHVTAPEGYMPSLITDAGEDLTTGPGERYNGLWHITPNPSWEEVTFTANVPVGSSMLLDSIFVSTACVPEPSAFLALGTGLFGLCGMVIKKRRKA